MRVRCLFIWLRCASPFIKVSWQLSPPVPRRFAAALRLRVDFYLTLRGYGLPSCSPCLVWRFLFYSFRCASLFIYCRHLPQGTHYRGRAGSATPLLLPPWSVRLTAALLCASARYYQRVPPHYCPVVFFISFRCASRLIKATTGQSHF